jgi:hypothetical protein
MLNVYSKSHIFLALSVINYLPKTSSFTDIYIWFTVYGNQFFHDDMHLVCCPKVLSTLWPMCLLFEARHHAEIAAPRKRLCMEFLLKVTLPIQSFVFDDRVEKGITIYLFTSYLTVHSCKLFCFEMAVLRSRSKAEFANRNSTVPTLRRRCCD